MIVIPVIDTPPGLLDLVTPKTRTPTPKYPYPERGCGFSSGQGQGRPEDTPGLPLRNRQNRQNRPTQILLGAKAGPYFYWPEQVVIARQGWTYKSFVGIHVMPDKTKGPNSGELSMFFFSLCCSCTDSGLSHLTFDCTRHRPDRRIAFACNQNRKIS